MKHMMLSPGSHRPSISTRHCIREVSRVEATSVHDVVVKLCRATGAVSTAGRIAAMQAERAYGHLHRTELESDERRQMEPGSSIARHKYQRNYGAIPSYECAICTVLSLNLVFYFGAPHQLVGSKPHTKHRCPYLHSRCCGTHSLSTVASWLGGSTPAENHLGPQLLLLDHLSFPTSGPDIAKRTRRKHRRAPGRNGLQGQRLGVEGWG